MAVAGFLTAPPWSALRPTPRLLTGHPSSVVPAGGGHRHGARIISPKFDELDTTSEFRDTKRFVSIATVGVCVANVLVLHGPNLNLLGSREPEVYGHATLTEIDADLTRQAEAAGHTLTCFQSNAEHALVERVQAARADGSAFIVINPAAFTHTSVALRDALAAVAIPFIEVHLSNPHAREPFRHTSYFSDLAVGVIAGFGRQSYAFALTVALQRLHDATR